MPQHVTIGAGAFPVQSEFERLAAWPPIAPGARPQRATAAALSDVDLNRLLAMPGFGRADFVARPAYADHAGTRAFGQNDRVIADAACWNWALTGATSFTRIERDTLMSPQDLLDVAALIRIGHPRALAIQSAYPGFRACYDGNRAAFDAWLGLAETTLLQKRAKMEALARIMCAVKGLPLAAGHSPYTICCEYSIRHMETFRGVPINVVDPPNFEHWGLQIGRGFGTVAHQSLQTVAGVGIWKNRSQSFIAEWTHVGLRDVVSVNVSALSPAHLARIRGMLDFAH